jgi:DNA/RNA endonuclease YhcR with UshA esterase domain
MIAAKENSDMRRMLPLICCFVLLCCLLVRADDATTQPAMIDIADKDAVAANMGKDVMVEGTVSKAEWSRTGAVMNVEFKGNEESRFYAAMFAKIRAKTDEAFGGDVAKALTGAKIRLKGKISEFRGRPQIIINDGNQITIVEPAPTTQEAK